MKEISKYILSETEINIVYNWVDSIQLSRNKSKISRDFSDGILAAEIIRSYQEKLIDLHNYIKCNNVDQKKNNWYTLKKKTFNRLKLNVKDSLLEDIVNCKNYAIEYFLLKLKDKLENYKEIYYDNTSFNSKNISQNKKINYNINYSNIKTKNEYIQNNYPNINYNMVQKNDQNYNMNNHNYNNNEQNNINPNYNYNNPNNHEMYNMSNHNNLQNINSNNNQNFSQIQNNSYTNNTHLNYYNQLLLKPNKNLVDMIHERDKLIINLREVLEIAELKNKKLEKLIEVKDNKISNLLQEE